MSRNDQGFTLIELMVVVMIIGILAAIAIPNFVAMQDRAREGSVKANMHSFQLAIEDFAVKNTGRYPVAADDGTVLLNMPGGVYPRNPYTNLSDPWVWGANPASPGIIGVNPATFTNYSVIGYGKSALLNLVLTNG